MGMAHEQRLRILRILLGAGALGWGTSVFGLVLPWPVVQKVLSGLGGCGIPNAPMVAYWAKMAAATGTGIGVFYLLLAVNPRRHASMLPFAGLFMLGMGLILLVFGLCLRVPAFPFWGDVLFGIVLGAGILALRSSAHRPE